jgi:hypothetical protein
METHSKDTATRICGRAAAQERFIVNSEQARERAERNFKRGERALDGRKAMAEYEAQAGATRKKTAWLRALRLAKEAEARDEPPPPKLAEQRPTCRQK